MSRPNIVRTAVYGITYSLWIVLGLMVAAVIGFALIGVVLFLLLSYA